MSHPQGVVVFSFDDLSCLVTFLFVLEESKRKTKVTPIVSYAQFNSNTSLYRHTIGTYDTEITQKLIVNSVQL
jgi:hypothetical protein